MKKNSIKILIGLIILLLFNGLFFGLGGTRRSVTEWLSYGFIHAAFLCLLFTHLLSRQAKGLTVLTASLHLQALLYFFTELTICCICLYSNPMDPTWPAIAQATALAVFLVLQLMSVLANDATKQSIQKQRCESIRIQSLAIRIQQGMRRLTDPSLRKQVERCYDAVHNTSIESFPEAAESEQALQAEVDKLCQAIDQGHTDEITDCAQRVCNAVQARNAIIRMCRK